MLFFRRKREPDELSWRFAAVLIVCVAAWFIFLRVVLELSEEWTDYWMMSGAYLAVLATFRSKLYTRGRLTSRQYFMLVMGMASIQVALGAALHRLGWFRVPGGLGTWSLFLVPAGMMAKGLADRITKVRVPIRRGARRSNASSAP